MSHRKPVGPGRAGPCFDPSPRARQGRVPVRTPSERASDLATLYGAPMPANSPSPLPPSKRIPSACPWSQLDLFAAGLAAVDLNLPDPAPAGAGAADQPRGRGDAGAARELNLSLGHLRTQGVRDA